MGSEGRRPLPPSRPVFRRQNINLVAEMRKTGQKWYSDGVEPENPALHFGRLCHSSYSNFAEIR
jgi:hypothetical protein